MDGGRPAVGSSMSIVATSCTASYASRSDDVDAGSRVGDRMLFTWNGHLSMRLHAYLPYAPANWRATAATPPRGTFPLAVLVRVAGGWRTVASLIIQPARDAWHRLRWSSWWRPPSTRPASHEDHELPLEY